MNLKRKQINYFFSLFVFLLFFGFAQTSQAMPDDREQVLQLTADNAEINEKTHRGEYSGDVQLDQGTSHLRAAKAITEGDNKNKLTLAVALGDAQNQAHFWTQTALDKPLLHAYANTIKYYPERHLIELIGNARVEQGTNTFSAPKITYDTVKQHVLSSKSGKERIVITVHPEKKI